MPLTWTPTTGILGEETTLPNGEKMLLSTSECAGVGSFTLTSSFTTWAHFSTRQDAKQAAHMLAEFLENAR